MYNTACKVSFVVLNYNDAQTTINYVNNIQKYEVIEHVVIVDNCSTDDSFEQLSNMASDKVDVVKSDRNGGYGYGNNFGVNFLVKKYNTKYIAISNPDVEVSEETVAGCMDYLIKNPNCAVVAPMMKMKNNKKNYRCAWRIPSFCQYLFFSLVFLGKFGRKMYYGKNFLDDSGAANVGCVAGSFLVVDSEKFAKAGMYDENIFLYCEETTLGIRLKKMNFDSALLRDLYFVHHHSTSINKSISSVIRQQKIMWNSREYVLKHYYRSNFFKNIIVNVVKRFALFEIWVYQKVKKHRLKR